MLTGVSRARMITATSNAVEGSTGSAGQAEIAREARQWAAEFVLATGLASSTDDLRFDALAGGVSADVVAVSGGSLDIVVKHALPELKVAALWEAAPTRIVIEAEALQLVGRICPGTVPRVIARDDERHGIALERAPRDARNWRDELLAGVVDLEVARDLGVILARFHAGTSNVTELREPFADRAMFNDLRIDPFYGEVAKTYPRWATAIASLLERMNDTQQCLVHGDYSPKNILIMSSGAWVLDWEVAHLGDPAFDLAFLLSHLVGKSLYDTESAHRYRSAADAFVEGYRNHPASFDIEESYLVHHIACLLLARIDGKSPLGYLDARARREGRAISEALLSAQSPSLASIWEAYS